MKMDNERREKTLEKMGFLLQDVYEMKENDYGICFIKDKVEIYAYWGRYDENLDIIINIETADTRRCISVYKHYLGRNALKMLRLPKDDIERFCVLADHFEKNSNVLLH